MIIKADSVPPSSTLFHQLASGLRRKTAHPSRRLLFSTGRTPLAPCGSPVNGQNRLSFQERRIRGLQAAASIIKERLCLMTALGSGQRNWAMPNHTIYRNMIN